MQRTRPLLSTLSSLPPTSGITTTPRSTWPPLPSHAAYLPLDNPTKRNALSRAQLQTLKDHLLLYNTSRSTGELHLLPPFKAEVLSDIQKAWESAEGQAADGKKVLGSTTPPSPNVLEWLVSGAKWRKDRKGLPNVIVLRASLGEKVFSAGHDLAELKGMESGEEVKETFNLCAEVMGLIQRSPVPVVTVLKGLATAAGAQLALSGDLVFAPRGGAWVRLPGATLGLPCTSPSTVVSRRLGNAFGYRLMALAEAIAVEDLPGGAVEVVDGGEEGLEKRVEEVVGFFAEEAPARAQALAKWAYWTQVGIGGRVGGGDGYLDAVEWAGRVMALHARTEEAREGMAAFVEKRRAVWEG